MKQFILFLLATIVISPLTFAQLSFEEETDPGVRSLLAANPQSMDDYMETAVLMGKLNRPDLTKHFLQKLLDKNPSETDWLQLNNLAQKISPAYLQEFVRLESLQPTGKTVAEKIYVVLQKTFESDDAVKQSLKLFLDAQWGSEESHSAFDNLNRSGINGVLALINALYANVQTMKNAGGTGNSADATQTNLQPALTADQLQTLRRNSQIIRTALTKINMADEPLIACLDCGDPDFLRETISILGRRGAPESTHYLLGFAAPTGNPIVTQTAVLALNELKIHPLTNSEAATVLIQAAKRSLEGIDPAKGEFGGKASGWIWNAKDKKPEQITTNEKVIRVLRAVRLARGAFARMPANDSLRRYYWVSESEYQACFPSEENTARLNQVLFESVPAELRPARYRDFLAFAMRFQYDASAQKACELLGSLKDESVLATDSDQPAELVCALAHPNPAVRWAAAEAIINIAPEQQYIGSCALISTLKWFIQGNGEQKILIACPKMEDAMSLANYLPAPYIGVPATTGKQALGILSDESDFAAVLYSSDMYSVPEEVFLEKARAIPSAAGLPIAIMAQRADWVKARNLTESRKYSTWFPMPTSPQDMDRGLNLISSVRRYVPEPAQVVKDRAIKAIEYTANLAESSYGDQYVANQRLAPPKSESASTQTADSSKTKTQNDNDKDDKTPEQAMDAESGVVESAPGNPFDDPNELKEPENEAIPASPEEDGAKSDQPPKEVPEEDNGDDPFVDNSGDSAAGTDDDPFSAFSNEAPAEKPQDDTSEKDETESEDAQPAQNDAASVNPAIKEHNNPFTAEIISASKDLPAEEAQDIDPSSLPALVGPGQIVPEDSFPNDSSSVTVATAASPEEALAPMDNPFENDDADPAVSAISENEESTDLPVENIAVQPEVVPANSEIPETKPNVVSGPAVSTEQPAIHERSPFVLEKKLRMREMYNLSSLIPVLRNRLMDDVNTDDSLKALACIPTSEAQYEIILYASSKLHTMEKRNLAITALDRSVSQFGLLMKSYQITRQYEITGTEQDEASIEILNKVLDIIETPWLEQDNINKSNVDRANKEYYPVKKPYSQWPSVLK